MTGLETGMAVQAAPADTPKRVSILGSTGSVGCNTVDLLERSPERYEVEALSAYRNVDLLASQARSLKAKVAVIGDEDRYGELKSALAGTGIEVAAGEQALIEAAERPADWLMAAIVGAAGLAPTLAAARRDGVVALANKECMVCAGDLLIDEVARSGATLLPVDSEHNAIFQVFDFQRPDGVEKIILTASGGPFRELDVNAMARVTPTQALAHPNWDMGARISIDSATMMNKGLELIEAFHLFPVEKTQVEVLVHPQSVVHSLVAYVDGSVLAQLGAPDMRTPIAHTLAWPERMATPSDRLDLAAIGSLSFEKPDERRFPCLRLAREALQAGGGAPCVLNAADEVAVQAFLSNRIGFLDIAGVVEQVLTRLAGRTLANLSALHAIDAEARVLAAAEIERLN